MKWFDVIGPTSEFLADSRHHWGFQSTIFWINDTYGLLNPQNYTMAAYDPCTGCHSSLSRTQANDFKQKPSRNLLRSPVSPGPLPPPCPKAILSKECRHWYWINDDRCRNLYVWERYAKWSGLLPYSNITVDAYTLRQVGQDDFEDVKVPDVPRAPSSSK